MLAAAAACRPAPVPLPTVAPPTPSPSAAARLKLGAVVDVGSRDAGSGTDRWQGALLGVETVNADGGALLPTGTRQELELLAYEVDGQTESVVMAMDRLARADGALAIIVDGRVDDGDVVGRQAERLATPSILLDERRLEAPTPAQWTFLLGASDVDAITVLTRFLAAHRVERVGWIAPRTATASTVRDALVRAAATTTVRVVAEESYAAAAEPAPEALARMAFAGAQAIVGWPRDVGEAASLVRVAAERAPGVAVYLGPVAADPAFLTRVGQGADGVRTIGPRLAVPDYLWDDDPLTVPTRTFLGDFRRRFGTTPSIQAAVAWDAVRIVASAIQRGGTDRRSLRDAIGRTEAFNGASGPIDLAGSRRGGLDSRAFVVMRAERGAWILPP